MDTTKNLLALDEAIDAFAKKELISGALRVTVKGTTVYEKRMGYANTDTKAPLTERSMFTIYSMSKPFCAIGLLRLLDEGKIDLQAHPSRYLPEARFFHPSVTLTHLLTHTSGVPDFMQTKAFFESHAPASSAEDMRALLPELAEYPNLFEPGTQGMYANINFTLAALIIENVSGMPYGDYMKKRVFEPLSMPYAVVDREGYECEQRAMGHALQYGRSIPTERSIAYMLGGGDILATVDDVYALNRAVKQKLLLKEQTWEMALTPSPINSMGMGCTVSMGKSAQARIIHNGGHVGFRTLHTHHIAEDFDVILLANCAHTCVRDVLYDLCVRHLLNENGVPLDTSGMDKGYI